MIETGIPQRALAALVELKIVDSTTIIDIRFNRTFMGTIDGTVITETVLPLQQFGAITTDVIVRTEYQWTGDLGWIRTEENRRRND